MNTEKTLKQALTGELVAQILNKWGKYPTDIENTKITLGEAQVFELFSELLSRWDIDGIDTISPSLLLTVLLSRKDEEISNDFKSEEVDDDDEVPFILKHIQDIREYYKTGC